MHLAYSAYPAGYNPQEADLLRRKFLATKVEGSCPINHMQALVVTFDVAVGLDMTQEAPVVLAEVTGPETVLTLSFSLTA
jgi:hypothetical protein